MNRKKSLLFLSVALILCLFSVTIASASGLIPKSSTGPVKTDDKAISTTSAVVTKATKGDSSNTQNIPPAAQSNSSIKIDTKTIALTGTIVTKPTNDGVAYILNTVDNSFAVIGPNVKSLSTYANTDKRIIVTGNPAIGAKIIVMVSFAEYVPEAPPNTPVNPGTPETPGAPSPPAPQTPPVYIKIDSKVITLTGTVTSVPTNDGVGYRLNAPEGSFAVIGPDSKSLSTYANTDKKITVTGNPAIGYNIIVMISYVEYTPPTPPAQQTPPVSIRIDSKVVSLTGTITTKPTNDGVAYILNTPEGSFAVIGPIAKQLSAYANTDKKITVTGNPAIGYNIIVMLSFTP